MRTTILLAMLVALASAPALGAAPPVCTEIETYTAKCEIEPAGVKLILGYCGYEPPECGPFTWLIRATSCADVEGPVAVQWEFFLSDLPAFAGTAESEPTGDASCPHSATFSRYHSGGTFTMPTECVRASAASPGGAAVELRCDSG